MKCKKIVIIFTLFLLSFSVSLSNAPFKKLEKISAIDDISLMLNENYTYDLNTFIIAYKSDPNNPIVVQVTDQQEQNSFLSNIPIEISDQVDSTTLDDKRDKLATKMYEYKIRADVLYVQPNYVIHTNWTRSGDADIPSEFDTTNNWNYDSAKLRQMWQDQNCQGIGGVEPCGGSSNVVVAVIDTGLAFETRTSAPKNDAYGKNPDMFGTTSINLFANSGEISNNGVDDDGNGYIDDYNGVDINVANYCDAYSCSTALHSEEGHPNDDYGHGTYSTEMIASRVDNSDTALNSVSPAFNVTIMPIKANIYHTGSFTAASEARAINYAVSEGADVINMSLGGACPESQAVLNALQNAKDKGVIVVAASGNDGSGTVGCPAANESVIAVGAVDPSGARSYYSQYGSALDVTAYTGSNPGVAGQAPTQVTYLCSFTDSCPDADTPGTTEYTTFALGRSIGTSFASPTVAGLAALVKSTKPYISYNNIKNYIYNNTDDLGATGWDSETGWGVINFEKTISALVANTSPSITVTEPNGIGDTTHKNFTIDWTASDTEDDGIINFYYDSDNTGLNGTAISTCSNISEDTKPNGDCTFSTKSLAAGNIYIYACIYDGVNQPVCAYSSGSITIDHSNVICGPIDVNSDSRLTLIDFADFASVYQKTCTDDASTYTGCGPKNTDYNSGTTGSGTINLIDFASFAQRYLDSSCIP